MHETDAQFRLMFVILPLGMAFAIALALHMFPGLWRYTIPDPARERNHTMDGARGLLTLWVLTFHLDQIPWSVMPGSHWLMPPGRLSTLQSSTFFVAPFFVLTAMLFGGYLLSTRGELNNLQFLQRRLFRLMPGYMVSIIFVFLGAFYFSGWELHTSLTKIFTVFIRWSSFDFLKRYDINGINMHDSHGMLWTLQYEVGFYLLIPLLAFGQRLFRTPLFLIGALALLGQYQWPFIFFTGGVIAAALTSLRSRYLDVSLQIAGVAAFIVLVMTVYHTTILLQTAVLIPILAGIAREAPLYRPLRVKCLRYVGEISYSVYILHYPILWIVFRRLSGSVTLDVLPVGERWSVQIAYGLAVLIIASVGYFVIERPLNVFGRSFEIHVPITKWVRNLKSSRVSA